MTAKELAAVLSGREYGMEIDREGNLILSCPNFAQPETSGCARKSILQK